MKVSAEYHVPEDLDMGHETIATSGRAHRRPMRAWRRNIGKSTVLALGVALICACANERAGSSHPSEEQKAMKESSPIHHEIDYIEISVTDMAEAKRFYGSAFDWEFNDYGPGYAGIRKKRGGEAGGLSLESHLSTGGPLVILYSTDLEATLASVRKAGGRITKEPFTFPGGRRFHFMDPSGNELAVWSEK